MKPSPFVLYSPTSVEQAVVMLADVADQDGRILAGGQTLVPAMALRFAQPAYLIDINEIRELQTLSDDGLQLAIRACVRHAAFHKPAVPGTLGQLLATVVRHIAHLPIRNRGTFCGSVANADPASEWCLVSATLDGIMAAQSTAGKREIPAGDFFVGAMTTALRPDELLTAVRLPLLGADARFGFEEFSRRAGDFAQAMALAVANHRDGKLHDVRIGVGGVEGTPRRFRDAEAVLEGQAPGRERYLEAAERVARACQPADSTEDGQAYRRHLARTVVMRALEKAVPCN